MFLMKSSSSILVKLTLYSYGNLGDNNVIRKKEKEKEKLESVK